MLILKKLILAPFVLSIFAVLIYQFIPFLKSYDFIFSLSLNTLVDLIVLSALICLSSFLFILFASLSGGLKFTLPASLLFALVPIIFLDISISLILAGAVFASFLVASLNLDNSLKSYLNFQAGSLLGPAIRHLSGFLILSFCLVYFLSATKLINQKGFQIPDSLIDTALKFSLPALPDKIVETPAQLTNDLIKQTVKDQIQNLIKPYQSFIPALLAVLVFLLLQSLTSILNLLIYPLLSATFYLLEKSGFIRFEIEQRPVRKMVV